MKDYSLKISEEERHRFEWIRRRILQDITKHWTIDYLGKKSGINTFKLKMGFKMLYGETVFGYLENQRMKLAIDMLLDSEKPIDYISKRCGYTHATNFTAAFKRKYDVTPMEFRKKHKPKVTTPPTVTSCMPVNHFIVYPARVLLAN